MRVSPTRNAHPTTSATKPTAPAMKLMRAKAVKGMPMFEAARLAPRIETCGCKSSDGSIKKAHGSQEQGSAVLKPVKVTDPERSGLIARGSVVDFPGDHSCPVNNPG